MITNDLLAGAPRIALTVSYEEPIWVGVIEKEKEGEHFVAREIFEDEPSLSDLYRWLKRAFPSSVKFSPS